MSGDSDKTEEPTEHKLQEARKKGQVFKSQDATSTLLLAATAGVLGATGAKIFWDLGRFALHTWSRIATVMSDPVSDRATIAFTLEPFTVIIKILAPLLAAGFFVAIFGNMAQIRFLFSTEVITPKLSKLNPIEGVKKIFSVKSLIELGKQVAKLVVIGWIVISVIKTNIPVLSNAIPWNLYETTSFLKKIVQQIIGNVLVGMAVISIIDFLLQKKQYMKQMKMSMQELKDEYKNTEGNPQVKGKIKQMMRQASQGRMMGDVAGASAIITNPTHLAVAIRYKQGEDRAPVVVAKGERIIAVNIKSIAEDNDIPIVENVELARALFGAAQVGQPIPPDMYKATAEVLAYVFKLKRRKEQRRKMRSRSMAR